MSGRTIAVRALCFAGVIAALVAFVPRAAAIDAQALSCSLAAAGLFAVGALLCLLGRLWSGIAAASAAVALVIAFEGRSPGAEGAVVDVGLAALPLVPALLAATVTSKRWLAAAAVGWSMISGLGHAMLYDPWLDPRCRIDCAHNPLTVVHRPGWATLADHSGTWAAAIIIALMIPSARRRPAMVAACIAAVSLADQTHPALLLGAAFVVIITLGADAAAAITVGVRLRELISALGSSLDLQQTLRVAIDDPDLTVAYVPDPDESGDMLVTRDGATAAPPGQGQISTAVRDADGLLAWIRHDPRSRDVERLTATLGGSARLAFEIERLEAIAALHSRRISDSRARLVQSGDLERRRLERDIHDGAQQFVLSLGMQIEIALLDIDPNDEAHDVLELSQDRVRTALDELRSIAHGLRPVPFEGAGLDVTLRSIARRAAVPVTLAPVPRRRFGADAESAAVAVVQSAIDIADGPLGIVLSDHDSSLELAINGLVATGSLGFLADRVAAAGGWARAEASTFTAVIPCAS